MVARRIDHSQCSGHAVMTESAIFVANHLINAGSIEFDSRIIHHPGHRHEIEIGANQNQAVGYVGCADINVHGRASGHSYLAGFKSPHPGYIVQFVVGGRMCDQFALLERFHTCETSR